MSVSDNESRYLTQPKMNGIANRAWDFWIRRSWMLWVLAALILILDQSTKSIIIAWLDWGESWPAEGFLRFTHARNTGTAFSLFQGHSKHPQLRRNYRRSRTALGLRHYRREILHPPPRPRPSTRRSTWQPIRPSPARLCNRLHRRWMVAHLQRRRLRYLHRHGPDGLVFLYGEG